MHNSPRLLKDTVRCELLMHPDAAGRRDINDGDRVVVTSRVGSIQLPVKLTDEVMPTVVSMPFGWGHHREGTRLSVAQGRPGASVNDLTDETHVDALTGTAAFSGVPVAVGTAPEVEDGER